MGTGILHLPELPLGCYGQLYLSYVVMVTPTSSESVHLIPILKPKTIPKNNEKRREGECPQDINIFTGSLLTIMCTNQSQQLLALWWQAPLGNLCEGETGACTGRQLHRALYMGVARRACWISLPRHYLLHNRRGQHYPLTVPPRSRFT